MGIVMTVVAVLALLVGSAAMIKGKITTVSGSGRYAEESEQSVRGIGAGVLAFGLLILALASLTIISPKNVGVQTSFGRATGTLDNGWHLVAPWSSVESFDATRQSLKLSGGGDDNGDPIVVRLANGTTATVEVSLEWQLDDKADITQLYLDYRSFENIQDNVVRRRLSAALNTVFESYDPLAMIKGDGAAEPVSTLETTAAAALQKELPNGILVRTMYLPKIVFADSVQAQINQYVNAVNETKIAQQQKLTAEARQQANDKLANGNLTSGVLYQNCLDMVERMTKEGKALPPAFTCGAGPTAVVPVK